MRAAVIYPFFPHYRAPVMRELITNSEHEIILVGAREHVQSSIKPWVPSDESVFIEAPCFKIGPFLFQRNLLGTAWRKDIDCLIVHAGTYWPSIWMAALVGKLRGKKIYNWTHGWVRPSAGFSGLIRRLIYRLFDGFLLYGHVGKVLGMQEGVAPSKLHVIYNSLDVDAQIAARSNVTQERLLELRKKFFGDPDKPVVTCTTRLVAVRGLDFLLEAVARLKKEGKEVNVLLVGDGPEREPLEQLSSRLGVRTHFFGSCYDEQMLAELVMVGTVTVAPGKIGLTAMHSLVFGRPVITHDDVYEQMPEWEAIIPGKTGTFFTRGDLGSLARAIDEVTADPWPTKQIEEDCHKQISRFYNPGNQKRLIDRALRGDAADDLDNAWDEL